MYKKFLVKLKAIGRKKYKTREKTTSKDIIREFVYFLSEGELRFIMKKKTISLQKIMKQMH
ncbi:hypothetical protein FXW07_18800 [Methanosarcina sp. DH1]|uniref:hypothetical protein n=1 Tax=Methanosarcina sp. DH1 TaxID=2605695 RepID=UPI001E45E464|nr:hypothetical protein [Methanosarcina sp. DH1]MCC4768590.1 hypothetical protein [Methanosarcina sp. DH1]